MDAAAWRAGAAAALASAEERARRGTGRIACGFTDDVDIVVHLDGEQLADLARDGDVRPATAGIGFAATPAALLAELLRLLSCGRGGEIALANEAIADWIAARFAGRRQLGGTGAQAAHTLARLGFDALVHVTSLSPAQAALMDGSGRLLLATPHGLQRPATAARAADPTLVNFIFEYPAGLTIPLAERPIVTPHANRVIVSDGSLNARMPLDPRFFAAVADPTHRVDRVLISGFGQIADEATAKARIAATAAAIAGWRRSRPGVLVHLELAATPESAVAAAVLGDLAPHVDSIGCNADELDAILGARGEPLGSGIAGTLGGLRTLQRRLGRPRLGLHTQDYCLTLTEGDPVAERDALSYAALVAGARARLGTFPTPADLRATLGGATPSPLGMAALAHLAATVGLRNGIARLDGGWLVAVPTFATPHPAGTVGLGDSFTAGLLAML